MLGSLEEAQSGMGNSNQRGETRRRVQARPKVELELRPDGWERFERAVDAAVKGGPKHRVKGSPPASTGPCIREHGASDATSDVAVPLKNIMQANSETLETLTNTTRGSRSAAHQQG